MAAVKASTCINVFMRRRTSTHTHTHSLSVKAFCMSAQQRKTRRKAKARGRQGGENARKNNHNSQFCWVSKCFGHATRQRRSLELRCLVANVLAALPWLGSCCRCIASMPCPQRGIFHIGMCTMEITMQSLTTTQPSEPHRGPKYSTRCISKH